MKNRKRLICLVVTMFLLYGLSVHCWRTIAANEEKWGVPVIGAPVDYEEFYYDINR